MQEDNLKLEDLLLHPQVEDDTDTINNIAIIGAYTATMGRLDVLVFTGGIGENAVEVREEVCSDMKYLGIELDDLKNENNETVISTESSKVTVIRIPTNEELVIAMDTNRIVEELVN